MTVDEILGRLDRVRKNGTGWTARCPAHEDSSPSLTIGVGDDERTLLKCHAGCTVDAILAALHLEPADLFTANGNGASRRIVATYDYTDPDGTLLYQVVKFDPKDFRQRRPDPNEPDGWAWNLHGVKRTLYNAPALAAAAFSGGPVYFVEGEKDADALTAIGATATTSPMGAGKWRSEYADQLRGLDVIVVADRDEPGRAHAQQAAASLAGIASSVRILEPAEGKDVSDHLAAGHTLDQLQPLAAAAAAPGPAGLRLRAFSEITPRNVLWLLPGMIPLRALTLVAGVGGLGKSTWAFAVAAQLSAGRLGEPAHAIIVSFEDPAAEVIRPRLEAAGADLERVHEITVDGDGLDMIRLPTDVAQIAELVHQVAAKLIVIDPIVAAIEAEYDAHKDQHVRHVLGSLRALAEEHGCAIILIGHLNKNPSNDAYIRVGSSIAFWNASRSVVLVTEDPDDQESGRLLAQRKANWSRVRPVERHRVESIVLPDTVDPTTGKPIETSRMIFVEHANDVDGADVLGKHTGKATDAKAFLLAALDDDEWHDSAGLKLLAGCSERTLQRAANDLDVETDRRGFPASTWWRLPQSRHALDHTAGATEEMAQQSGSNPPVAPTAMYDATDGATANSGATADQHPDLDEGTIERLADLARADESERRPGSPVSATAERQDPARETEARP